jgi:hypothetical protein
VTVAHQPLRKITPIHALFFAMPDN